MNKSQKKSQPVGSGQKILKKNEYFVAGQGAGYFLGGSLHKVNDRTKNRYNKALRQKTLNKNEYFVAGQGAGYFLGGSLHKVNDRVKNILQQSPETKDGVITEI